MPTSPKNKSWREILPIHPAADMFPLMSRSELKELADDIKQHGLRQPVCIVEDDRGYKVLIDGRNRLDALELLGDDERLNLENYIVFEKFPDGFDIYARVVSLNLHRRHLAADQKRDLIARLLKATPEKSDRQIAETVKADHKTVAAVRAEKQATGEIPQLRKTVGKDGKARTTKKQRRDIDDYLADKKKRMEAKAESRAAREADLARRITALPAQRHGVIYADPPWRFEPYSRETGMDRAADNHYPTMPTEEIAAIDIAEIAATDCVLFLWATVPMLPDALRVMEAWGFRYKSHIVWDKVHLGTGFWARNRHELLLIGTRGDIPAPAPGQQSESLVGMPCGAHSAKPEWFAELIGRYFPNLPKIELFARQVRPGWTVWGNEIPSAPPTQPDDFPDIPECMRRSAP
jgi:N6-adenosine-specific RNA methylase IME4/ParB-like chromosome segregation protein Spo0J